MPEHVSISRGVAGAGLLALAALACTAGLAAVRRRGQARRSGRGRRGRAVQYAAAAPQPVRRTVPGIPAIPGQRRTGPRTEAVRLTPEERDAFAGLVRRFRDGGRDEED
ncbi:hypothetical protein HCJ93_14625 [Streptomyces sp. SBST2-5]|uniref:Uncharacterized protein n=1 Tax=Streptomyces composti TaxID=2720025 RepID=A0ABX1A4C4_9ACTN|nr:hypothetical protein [Streptomyces composti]NJP51275.1 hypothetical protein [Streptomyces composti]